MKWILYLNSGCWYLSEKNETSSPLGRTQVYLFFKNHNDGPEFRTKYSESIWKINMRFTHFPFFCFPTENRAIAGSPLIKYEKSKVPSSKFFKSYSLKKKTFSESSKYPKPYVHVLHPLSYQIPFISEASIVQTLCFQESTKRKKRTHWIIVNLFNKLVANPSPKSSNFLTIG